MPIDAELEARKKRLETELDLLIKWSRQRARWNHWLAIYVMFFAVGCSITAGIAGLSESAPKSLIGILGFLPGAIAVMASQFKWEARSGWHHRKLDALNALKSRLLYQLPIEPLVGDIANVSKARDELIKQMQAEWDKLFVFRWSFKQG